MPRQARLDVGGTLHHVIIRGIEKKPIFADDLDREGFICRMGKLALETGTKIYAFSLMTNHAHVLLRSSSSGLPQYMRRLLTGHAQSFNRRHERKGYLFQNRYKSIVCDEEVYFQELVRYIHLNPFRAGLVTKLEQLDRYRWAGHGALMGKIPYSWQDTDYVLSGFGRRVGLARRVYRRYVADGISQGNRPELVGGGLVRSLGGWAEVKSLRRSKEKVLTDERILGTDDFVEGVLREAEGRVRHSFSSLIRSKGVQELIETTCKKEGISLQEMQMGSRRGAIAKVRSHLALKLVQELGIPLAEIARQLGVSTSAVCQILRRKQVN